MIRSCASIFRAGLMEERAAQLGQLGVMPVLRLDFRLVFEVALMSMDWPLFTIRGALGYAVRRLCCTMSLADCAACPRRAECLYSYLFETPVALEGRLFEAHDRAPHPFVLVPGARTGNELCFGVLLFGEAVRYAALFASAMRELADDGIGQRQARFTIAKIVISGKERQVWQPGMPEPSITAGKLADFMTGAEPQDGGTSLVLSLLTHCASRCGARSHDNLHSGTLWLPPCVASRRLASITPA